MIMKWVHDYNPMNYIKDRQIKAERLKRIKETSASAAFLSEAIIYADNLRRGSSTPRFYELLLIVTETFNTTSVELEDILKTAVTPTRLRFNMAMMVTIQPPTFESDADALYSIVCDLYEEIRQIMVLQSQGLREQAANRIDYITEV